MVTLEQSSLLPGELALRSASAKLIESQDEGPTNTRTDQSPVTTRNVENTKYNLNDKNDTAYQPVQPITAHPSKELVLNNDSEKQTSQNIVASTPLQLLLRSVANRNHDNLKPRQDVWLDRRNDLRIQSDDSKRSNVDGNLKQGQSLVSHSLYAYAFVIGGCDPDRPAYRNYIYDVLIATNILKEKGSKSDVHVFFQMSFRSPHNQITPEEMRWLTAMNVTIHYIPKYQDESFYKIMLEKFQVLTLLQYRRVFFLDADVMPLANLDYLMELSDKGVLRENILVPGTSSAGNGGFFILKPFPGAMDRLQQLIREKDKRISTLPPPFWDERLGWGREIIQPDYWENRLGKRSQLWNFYGVFTDQGLLFHWAKYERKSVTLVFPKGRIENWGPASPGAENVILQETLSADNVLKDYPQAGSFCLWHKCEGPVIDDHFHFGGKRKPWLLKPPKNITTMVSPPERGAPVSYWFWQLHQVNQKLHMGLDIVNWRVGEKPLLGFLPESDQVKQSLQASNLSLANSSISLDQGWPQMQTMDVSLDNHSSG